MRVIRILLQIFILVSGAYLLVASLASEKVGLGGAIGILAFFGFLWVLTLMLKEETQYGADPKRDKNPKVIGSFLAFFGVGSCYMGVDILGGYTGEGLHHGRLLPAIIKLVGPWPPALFFFFWGVVFLKYALAAFRQRREFL